MKVLITGAAGAVGQSFIESSPEGEELVLVSRKYSDDGLLPENASLHEVDFTNQADISGVFELERPDVVLHLASVIGPACEQDPELAHRVNVEATEQLALTAARFGVKRFVFLSTAAVYKQTELEPTSEDENVDPQSEYGKSKLAGEGRLQTSSESEEIATVVLRGFNIYGERFKNALVYKLINSTEDSLVGLLGPDNFYRDYVHISDVLTAVRSSFEADLESKFQVFNIASGVALSNQQVIDQLIEQGQDPKFTLQESGLNPSWANIDYAKKILGFDPDPRIRTD